MSIIRHPGRPEGGRVGTLNFCCQTRSRLPAVEKVSKIFLLQKHHHHLMTPKVIRSWPQKIIA